MRDKITGVLSVAITVFWILTAVLLLAAAYTLVQTFQGSITPEAVASVGFGVLLVATAFAARRVVPRRAPNRPA